MYPDNVFIINIVLTPPNSNYGWLLASEVPEPATVSLIGTGLGLLGITTRRNKRRQG